MEPTKPLTKMNTEYPSTFISISKAWMCGIIAYLGTDPIATDVVIHGIKLLQNRGYDSAGIEFQTV